ncbi:hypothetical protein BC829DRAFT_397700 [Chytridium lagenaria]|nr:hypothetical protein BC829DRAFT_397700 [Chytridium lagenaria]
MSWFLKQLGRSLSTPTQSSQQLHASSSRSQHPQLDSRRAEPLLWQKLKTHVQLGSIAQHLAVQTKVFKKWCNMQLSKASESAAGADGSIDSTPPLMIRNMNEDLKDGVILLKLLAAITGEQLPEPEGLRTVDVAAEEIIDGNVKLTLG